MGSIRIRRSKIKGERKMETFEQFIKTLNKMTDLETLEEEAIYVEVLGLTYNIIGAEEYTGEDADGEPYTLCKLFLAYNDERNSTECEILITEEEARKVVEEYRKGEAERKELLGRMSSKIREQSVKEFLQQLEKEDFKGEN
jgi:hypothetical protein